MPDDDMLRVTASEKAKDRSAASRPTRGEAEGRGSQAKWNHGKYRKQAEADPVRDENQSREDNIREKQTRLKSEAYWSNRKPKAERKSKARGKGRAKRNRE